MRENRRRGPPRRAPRNVFTRGQPRVRPTLLPTSLDEVRVEAGIRNEKPSWFPKVLRLPNPKKLHFPYNDDYSKNTSNAIGNIKEKIFEKTKELEMVKNLTGIGVKFDKKKYLIEEIIPSLEKESDNLAKENSLDKHKDIWSPELWSINREIEIMKYEALKEENNSFLKAFDINFSNGPNLRALNSLNSDLVKSKTWKHIKDGMLFTQHPSGVRIIVDVKGTIQSCLKEYGRQVECLVGPENFRVCLNWQNKCPGADAVLALLLYNWHPVIMKTMAGDGGLDINYQIQKWTSRNYSTIKNLVEIEYEEIINDIDSIEVLDTKCDVIISSISKDIIAKLIGKKGNRVEKIRDLIRKELINKHWRVSIQQLE
jgi:hypothetical protein